MKQGSVQRGRYEYDIEAGKQQAGNVLAEVYFRGKTAEKQSGGTVSCPAALLFGGYALLVRNGAPRRGWLGQCFAAQGGALLPNISGKEVNFFQNQS